MIQYFHLYSVLNNYFYPQVSLFLAAAVAVIIVIIIIIITVQTKLFQKLYRVVEQILGSTILFYFPFRKSFKSGASIFLGKCLASSTTSCPSPSFFFPHTSCPVHFIIVELCIRTSWFTTLIAVPAITKRSIVVIIVNALKAIIFRRIVRTRTFYTGGMVHILRIIRHHCQGSGGGTTGVPLPERLRLPQQPRS